MTSELLRPLSEVPVGDRVLHNGRVASTADVLRSNHVHLCYLNTDDCANLNRNALVLHLEGHEPRPLTAEDVGRWVLVDPDLGHAALKDPVRVVERDSDGDGWHCDDDWSIAAHWPCWRIVEPEHSAGEASEPDKPRRWVPCRWPDGTWGVDDRNDESDSTSEHFALSLADHLNATGWSPPEPEPDRPSWLEVVRAWLDDDPPPQEVVSVHAALREADWATVDLRPLREPIGDMSPLEWLRRWVSIGSRDAAWARAVLVALGEEAGDDARA